MYHSNSAKPCLQIDDISMGTYADCPNGFWFCQSPRDRASKCLDGLITAGTCTTVYSFLVSVPQAVALLSKLQSQKNECLLTN